MPEMKTKSRVKVHLKVTAVLFNEEGQGFLGSGHYMLLSRIASSHSISEAAREMGMSYSKAHRLIRTLEKNTGRQILVTHIGGMERGGAELTPFARTLIAAYEQFLKEVQEDALKRFRSLEKLLNAERQEEV
jgi:molybdate transport system regulatory protein